LDNYNTAGDISIQVYLNNTDKDQKITIGWISHGVGSRRHWYPERINVELYDYTNLKVIDYIYTSFVNSTDKINNTYILKPNFGIRIAGNHRSITHYQYLSMNYWIIKDN